MPTANGRFRRLLTEKAKFREELPVGANRRWIVLCVLVSWRRLLGLQQCLGRQQPIVVRIIHIGVQLDGRNQRLKRTGIVLVHVAEVEQRHLVTQDMIGMIGVDLISGILKCTS